MAKERIVRATFANGYTMQRGSIGRVYTHAYVAGGAAPDGKRWGVSGFSTSEAQCHRNMNSESAWFKKQPGYTLDRAEVVAVEVIPARV